jgi:hypothetical protein
MPAFRADESRSQAVDAGELAGVFGIQALQFLLTRPRRFDE